MPRRLAALLATAAAMAAVLLPNGAASAAPISRCTATTGTIVAVDFGHWGGPFVRGCGVGSASGYDLLRDGGFSTAGDQHDGPAFICRIGNASFAGGTQYPTPSDDACILTPPASAYWSYWLAPRGQNTWSYSQLGAMSDVPKAGEVQLWQFGATNVAGTKGRPTVTPAQLRATNAAPAGGATSRPAPRTSTAPRSTAPPSTSEPTTPSTTAPNRPSHSGAAPTTSVPRTSAPATSHVTNPPSVTSDPPTTPTTAPATAPSRHRHHRDRPTHDLTTAPPRRAATSSEVAGSAGGSAPTPTAASSTSGPAIVTAAPAADNPTPSSGSATPVIVAIVLVVLLGGGAGWTVWRRRRGDS